MGNDFIVLDGGLATELVKRGFNIDNDPLWSARVLSDNPDAIKQVHISFLESGADVVITASYQASISGFCTHLGISTQEAQQLIKNSVHLARQACNEFWENYTQDESKSKTRIQPMVAGSVGPYGACQHDGSEYTGNYVDHLTIEELKTWHRPRIKSLVEAGVDLLALETIPAQKEAEAIASLLEEFPDTKAWLSFCCKDGKHTVHGEELFDAVQSALSISKQIVAVGVNCCSPEYVKSLLENIHGNVNVPLVAYPNSGEEWVNNSWQSIGKVSKISEYVSEWISVGARWIGGCCRTSPVDICQVYTAINQPNY